MAGGEETLMADTLRVCVAGLVHDHVWGMLRWWKELEGAELVAAAGVNPPLLEKIRAEHGVANSYSSYQEMLEREKPNIVLVATGNASSADVVEAAAGA